MPAPGHFDPTAETEFALQNLDGLASADRVCTASTVCAGYLCRARLAPRLDETGAANRALVLRRRRLDPLGP